MTSLPSFCAGLLFLFGAASASAQDFDEQGMPTYEPIDHYCDLKLPPPNPTGNPDLRLEGNGGFDPVRYDYDLGVLVDPVSGIPDASQGNEYGDKTDSETGARFSMSLGLWVDPETNDPIRDRRLNDFPYYDPDTHEMIDPETGYRTPFEMALLTNGQIRSHAEKIAYACLGSDLSQRVDPKSGLYVASTRVSSPDDYDFPTIGVKFDDYFKPGPLRDMPNLRDFPSPVNFSAELAKTLDLINGMSRSEAIAKLYDRLGPETSEMGVFDLRERRSDDGLVVIATGRELMDDAVSAEQVYLYFMTDMPAKDGSVPPRLMGVGYRHKCSRRSFQAAWTTQRCP